MVKVRSNNVMTIPILSHGGLNIDIRGGRMDWKRP